MGLLRLFLALSVIAGHAQTTIFGANGIGAWYAVNFFFIISGFYMAMVLNGKYKEVSNYQFYKSRVLRLFPAYYIGLGLAVVVSYAAISGLFSGLTIISKIIYVFQNLFIVGQDLSYLFCVKTHAGVCADSVALTINPPAWSLAVELGFYLVAPFVLKSQKKTFLFVLAGALYLGVLNFIEFPISHLGALKPAESWAYTYYFYPSSFAFFGGGALAYHLSKNSAEPNYFAAVGALVVLSMSQTIMPFWHLLFFSMAIPVLFKYTANNKVDRVIGELSYPVYILHFPILILVQRYSSAHPEIVSMVSIGTLVAIVSIVLGAAVYYFVERKVSNFRHSDEFICLEEQSKSYMHYNASKLLAATYLVIPLIVTAYIITSQHDVRSIPSSTPYNLTDSNWNGGINKSAPAFFIKSSDANLKTYTVGAKVKFGASGVREIVRVDKSPAYINVFLNGGLLSGEGDGYPNKIYIE
jgi:peptidoglycan/LPS O-acetylase OafA/YrhL